MNNVRTVTASLVMVLLLSVTWAATSRSQVQRSPAASRNDISSSENNAGQRQGQPAHPKEMSQGEKLVRAAYARLMRYQTAAQDEKESRQGKSSGPEDYLTFELRGVHTGPIEEISGRRLDELVTLRSGEILTIKPTHLSIENEPAHAYYEAEWATVNDEVTRPTSGRGRLGQDKELEFAPMNGTVGRMLRRGGERFVGLGRYTSYEVTIHFDGKERTYRALALFEVKDGSSRPKHVEILDNITSEMTTVVNDESPRVQSPWNTYVKSNLYLAIVREITNMKRAGSPLIPEAAPIGYLPGDDVPLSALVKMRTAMISNAACYCVCQCPTPLMSDSEWAEMHGWFPNLERCSTCKTGPATTTYNCMAWTLDDTSRWWWDQADANGNGLLSNTELNAFYSSKGKSNIAYYGNSASDVVHVAKKSGGLGMDCQITSKIGSSLRIAHDMTNLAGGDYGSIVGGN